MQPNDVLMKKWCFGMGRSKKREEVSSNSNGELQTWYSYPKYRTIVFKVSSVEKKKEQLHVKGKQFSSLNGKPKEKTLIFETNGENQKVFFVNGQTRPFLNIGEAKITEDGIPPVGSLITVDKKHAIVTEVGRNELTVFVDNQLKKIVCRPGQIKWRDDKILKAAVN
jgi:hypothetical protein